MRDKPTPLPVKILEDGQAYFMVPRFWPAELMGSHSCYTNNGKRTKSAERIPASFWKYLIYLWGWIMNGNPERVTTQSMREFPVRPDAAVRWTAALSVSGLFDVEIGKYTAAHDKPTLFRYRVAATKEEWGIFIRTLDLFLVRARKNRDGANTGAFKYCLAHWVDDARVKAGFPKVNEKFIADVISGKIRDSKGRLIVERDKAGKPEVQWWRNPKRQPMTEGHPKDCRCDDCLAMEQMIAAEDEEETERAPY